MVGRRLLGVRAASNYSTYVAVKFFGHNAWVKALST